LEEPAGTPSTGRIDAGYETHRQSVFPGLPRSRL